MQKRKTYQALAGSLVKSLRGEKSQNQINRRLGYRYNQMSKWERVYQNISWVQFLALSEALRIDLRKTLRKTFGYYGDQSWRSLLNFLQGHRPLDDFAEQLNISKRKLKCWLNGEVEPLLFEVLWLLDRVTVGLPSFLEDLAPDVVMSSMRTRYRKLKSEGDLLAQFPDIGWVLCSLELKTANASSADVVDFISETTGFTRQKINRYLAILVSNGLICRRGNRFQLNRLEGSADTGVSSLAARVRMKIYLAEKALTSLRKIEKPHSSVGRTFNHLIFNASEESFMEIKQLSQTYYHDVRSILIKDRQPKTRLGFLNLHICTDEFLRQINESFGTPSSI